MKCRLCDTKFVKEAEFRQHLIAESASPEVEECRRKYEALFAGRRKHDALLAILSTAPISWGGADEAEQREGEWDGVERRAKPRRHLPVGQAKARRKRTSRRGARR